MAACRFSITNKPVSNPQDDVSFEYLLRRSQRLGSLIESILSINGSILAMRDIEGLFELILARVLAAIDHANAGCVLKLESDGFLHIVAAQGYPAETAQVFRVKLEDTFQWKKSGGRLSDTLLISDLQRFMKEYGIPDTLIADERGRTIRSSMSSPIFAKGKFYGLINLDSCESDIFDDTDRILAEYVRSQVPIALETYMAHEQIRELLDEKELILREVHHRVKNNMATIGSILSIQAQTVHDAEARQAVEDAYNRLLAMARLYEKLFLSQSYRSFRTSAFLSLLVEEIVANSTLPDTVALEQHIEDFEVGARNIQPLSLIVNEVLLNSIKYAFVGRKCGRIKVSARYEGELARIEIRDDGTGFTIQDEGKEHRGFGLILVDTLVKQMGGRYTIEGGEGTRFVLDFKP